MLRPIKRRHVQHVEHAFSLGPIVVALDQGRSQPVEPQRLVGRGKIVDTAAELVHRLARPARRDLSLDHGDLAQLGHRAALRLNPGEDLHGSRLLAGGQGKRAVVYVCRGRKRRGHLLDRLQHAGHRRLGSRLVEPDGQQLGRHAGLGIEAQAALAGQADVRLRDVPQILQATQVRLQGRLPPAGGQPRPHRRLKHHVGRGAATSHVPGVDRLGGDRERLEVAHLQPLADPVKGLAQVAQHPVEFVLPGLGNAAALDLVPC